MKIKNLIKLENYLFVNLVNLKLGVLESFVSSLDFNDSANCSRFHNWAEDLNYSHYKFFLEGGKHFFASNKFADNLKIKNSPDTTNLSLRIK